MYLTNIPSIGDCWSVCGSDLSLVSSWKNIHLDNLHLELNSTNSSLMSQHFLFHSIRTGEYSFAQYRDDILARDKTLLK